MTNTEQTKTFDIINEDQNGLNRIENSMFLCWIETTDNVNRSVQTFVELTAGEKRQIKIWHMDKKEGFVLTNDRDVTVHFKQV